MIDELQALCDRIRSVPWPFVDIQAEQRLVELMRGALPQFLRLARAAKAAADTIDDKFPRPEWAELLAAVAELGKP